MLAGISIFCFAASYAVALALEVSRLFLRVAVRLPIMIGFAIAGVIAQVLYLFHQATQSQDTFPLSSWYHWCLIASLVLALIYVYLAISRPSSSVGIFMLPMVLGMIGLAYTFQNAAPFPKQDAIFRIGMIHGITLLCGTVAALLGLSAGLMYLVQDYRLKHKLPPKQGLRLPSLEWLQTINERALLSSGLFLLLGLGSGAMLNLYRTVERPEAALSWNDPVVWFSGLLFAWLVVALLFNLFYKPAREGHKVVYLTLASCVLLALVMTVVLFSSSAHPPQANSSFAPRKTVVCQKMLDKDLAVEWKSRSDLGERWALAQRYVMRHESHSWLNRFQLSLGLRPTLAVGDCSLVHVSNCAIDHRRAAPASRVGGNA